LVVPGAFVNSALEGLAASYGKLWTSAFAILWVSDNPTPWTASFGYTFQDGPTASEQTWNPNKGARGSYRCKVGRHAAPTVIGPLTSYLITTPVT